MPIPTPFHNRTAALCRSAEWRDWAGYQSAVTYEPSHEYEYYAIRNAAALIDISGLFKYSLEGPDAADLVDRVVTRDISKCKIGQVMYTPWCDEAGKVIDDGTVQRFADNIFRITSAHPNLRWFQDCALGMDVDIRDISENQAALSLQGPNSRNILKEIVSGANLDNLKFFYLAKGQIDGFEVVVTRTGYTGDLGYEIWAERKHAEALWDAIISAGRAYGIAPVGLAAMDITRIEAGFLLLDIDYISSNKAIIEAQKSSPYEIGLGWAVKLKGADFVGKRALLHEKENPGKWAFVGIEIDWVEMEKKYLEEDLPPQVAGRASRVSVPLYINNRQVGQATSSTFSPILKKYIAIGTVERQYAAPGTALEFEITVEYSRYKTAAKIVKLPFFNPERKRR